LLVLAVLGLCASAGILLLLLQSNKGRRRKRYVHNGFVKAAAVTTEGKQYGAYTLSAGETVICVLAGGLCGFAVGYLFYHHLVPALLSSLSGLWVPGWRRQSRIRKQKEELKLQFKQGLHALVSSLTAGRSVENAFGAALADLQFLYTNPQTSILTEFERITRKLANGETVEAALTDFCRRSQLEELQQFTDVFTTCKRTGGNLAEVMRRTAQIIGDKMEIQQEIAVQLAQKRFESKILGAAPIAVIGMLYWSSPDYMEPLYGNPAGAVIMTVCLAMFAGCWWMTGKMMEMKV
jgi:tight adherence protein B